MTDIEKPVERPALVVGEDLPSDYGEPLDTDYATASEFQPDFESDCEPPSDKVMEKKLIIKEPKFRIYKKIIKIGKGIFMPAKFDRVTYKHIKCTAEDDRPDALAELPYVEHQMGLSPEINELLLLALQSMKPAETAMFIIEKIGKNPVNHQRVLKGMEYFICEMQTWTTVIDLFGCLRCMKTMLIRSNKKARYTESDEIQFRGKIMQGGKLFKTLDTPEPVKLRAETHSAFLIKLLETMKPDEDVIIDVDPDYIIEQMEEVDHPMWAGMDREEHLEFHLTIERNHVIHDVYADGSLMVKKWQESFTTAQAEPSSKMFFDYKIMIGENQVYASTNNWLKIAEKNLEGTGFIEECECKKYF
jgi:hypothetical protein